VSYKDDYKTRNSRIDIADSKCETFLKDRNAYYIRYGFDQQGNKIKSDMFFKIPTIIRKQPDFIIISQNSYFLEVKGCRDILRLKQEDIKAYNFWQNLMNLYIFIYSVIEREHKIISYARLNDIAISCTMGYYEDNGKAYYKIPWELIR